MCTVSFVRTDDCVIITSNRDEHIERQYAAAPQLYVSAEKKVLFPKDPKAGGTWFAAADNGTVAVLLNGAFEKHIPEPVYRKSRGLILLDIIEATDPYLFFTNMNLHNIEPFTLVLYQVPVLHELRWDGNNKHDRSLDSFEDHIWSSATLYTARVIQKRKELFERFTGNTENMSAELVADFHGYNHGDAENGFVIDRPTGMRTFSITQAVVKPTIIQLIHRDLLQDTRSEELMPITHATIKI